MGCWSVPCRASCEGGSFAVLDDSRLIQPACSNVAKLTSIKALRRRAEELLGPIIQERLDLLAEHNDDWPEKPVSNI